jgi:hypothetical protein
MVPLERLPMMLEQRQLHALAVTASSYTSGEHVTFYSAARRWSPGRVRSGCGALAITHDAPAGVVGHSLRLSGQAQLEGAGQRPGTATVRCGRRRRCRRPSTWARSGC